MIGRLHLGEVEVIVGAEELGVHNVVLDDGYARSKARQIGLTVTGTLGILITGRDMGILSDLTLEIDRLLKLGYRIHPSTIEQIKNAI